MTDEELLALRELSLKARPFTELEMLDENPLESYQEQAKLNNQLFYQVTGGTLAEIIEELLAFRRNHHQLMIQLRAYKKQYRPNSPVGRVLEEIDELATGNR